MAGSVEGIASGGFVVVRGADGGGIKEITMAGTFEVNDNGTITVAFAYTAKAAKIQARLNAAAHRLYNAGRGRDFTHIEEVETDIDESGNLVVAEQEVASTWDDLTNQQKLKILDEFVFSAIHEEAAGYLYEVRQSEAAARRAEDIATIL